jgi:hypothetical protein
MVAYLDAQGLIAYLDFKGRNVQHNDIARYKLEVQVCYWRARLYELLVNDASFDEIAKDEWRVTLAKIRNVADILPIYAGEHTVVTEHIRDLFKALVSRWEEIDASE